MASLIETCRLNAVDPEAWLADVLEKLVGGSPMVGIDDLMPWAPAFRKAEPWSKSNLRREHRLDPAKVSHADA